MKNLIVKGLGVVAILAGSAFFAGQSAQAAGGDIPMFVDDGPWMCYGGWCVNTDDFGPNGVNP